MTNLAAALATVSLAAKKRKPSNELRKGEDITEAQAILALSKAMIGTIRAINQSPWDSLDQIVQSVVDAYPEISVTLEAGFILVITDCTEAEAIRIHRAVRRQWPGYVRLRYEDRTKVLP